MLFKARFVAIAIATSFSVVACGGGGANVPNNPTGLTTVPQSQATAPPTPAPSCAPNLKCASVGILQHSINSQSSTRGKLSISPVNCPSGAWCVIQGQSITQTEHYWYPLSSDTSTAGVQILTSTSSTVPDVTFTVNPNPVAFTPATFSITINAGITAPVGVQSYIISGSATGWNLSSMSWPYYICDAKTGSCLPPTPAPQVTPTQVASCVPGPIGTPGGTFGSILSPPFGSTQRRALDACGPNTVLPTSTPSPKPTAPCPPPATPGPNPAKIIPLYDKNGSKILGTNGLPLYRKDNGHDPEYFALEGINDAPYLDQQIADALKFSGGNQWDEQRLGGGEPSPIANSKLVDWATVAIGIWGAASGIPEPIMQSAQQAYAILHHRDYGDAKPNLLYYPMPQRNVDNLHLGYVLYNSHVFLLCY